MLQSSRVIARALRLFSPRDLLLPNNHLENAVLLFALSGTLEKNMFSFGVGQQVRAPRHTVDGALDRCNVLQAHARLHGVHASNIVGRRWQIGDAAKGR